MRIGVRTSDGEGLAARVFWRAGPSLVEIVQRIEPTDDWLRYIDVRADQTGFVPCEPLDWLWIAAVERETGAVAYARAGPEDEQVELTFAEEQSSLHVVVWNATYDDIRPDCPVALHRRSMTDISAEIVSTERTDPHGYARLGGCSRGIYLLAAAGANLDQPSPDTAAVVTMHGARPSDELVFLCAPDSRHVVRFEVGFSERITSRPMLVARDLERSGAPIVIGVPHGARWRASRSLPAGRYRLETRPGGVCRILGGADLLEVEADQRFPLVLAADRDPSTFRFVGIGPRDLPMRVCVETSDSAAMYPDEDYWGAPNVRSPHVEIAPPPGPWRFVVLDRKKVWTGPWQDGGPAGATDVALEPATLLRCAAGGRPAASAGGMFAVTDAEGTRLVPARQSPVAGVAGSRPVPTAQVCVRRGELTVQYLFTDGRASAIVGSRATGCYESVFVP